MLAPELPLLPPELLAEFPAQPARARTRDIATGANKAPIRFDIEHLLSFESWT